VREPTYLLGKDSDGDGDGNGMVMVMVIVVVMAMVMLMVPVCKGGDRPTKVTRVVSMNGGCAFREYNNYKV
jgi:hypothetical protein